MDLFTYFIASVFFIYALLQIMYAFRKFKMHKKEKQLNKAGQYARGSGLSHGMVLNADKTGVIGDSRNSAAWYSRLV